MPIKKTKGDRSGGIRESDYPDGVLKDDPHVGARTENAIIPYDRKLAEKAIAQVEPIYRGDYGLGLSTGNRTIRQTDNRAEYELFRPITNIPKKQRDIIGACMNAYHRIGILRNVIDMMASFGCQGIQVVHPIKSREKLYKYWFRTVRGPERSERFLNGLYRAGNVIVKRSMAKLSAGDLRDLQRGYASLDADTSYERAPKPRRNEIPIDYTFLNPSSIEMAGGDLATFLGHPVYILRIPRPIITLIKTPKTPTEKEMVADLPEFIRGPIQAGEAYIRLDNDKLSVCHYMKDDWQQWALPMTYSILADLILYEKMKLADMAALEGAISHIRIWKLGDLKNNIQVGPALYQKLNDMLLSNIGGGAMDLIWDAAIDLIETKTDVSNFLGAAKYEPVLKAIFAGLGIPQSLSGGTGQGAGFTNNAISLKTLIERLTYGREQLDSFWHYELRILQEALGDKQPAHIIYDNMSLYDEAAEKMLWFQMYDRHLVDDSTMQEKFGLIPDVIQMRIKREEKQRNVGKKPPKASPFHDPQTDHELTKIALQQGTLSPTEAGVDKKEKKPGDKSFLDFQARQAQKERQMQEESNKQRLRQDEELHQQRIKHKDEEHKIMLPIRKDALRKKTQLQLQNQKQGVPGQGRPKNSKDSGPRKQRTPKPSTKAALDMFAVQQWAKEAQRVIAEAVNKEYLNQLGKSTLRSLSSDEVNSLEDLKFATLYTYKPMEEIEDLESHISQAKETLLIHPLPIRFLSMKESFIDMRNVYVERKRVFPSMEEQRDMRVAAYAIHTI